LAEKKAFQKVILGFEHANRPEIDQPKDKKIFYIIAVAKKDFTFGKLQNQSKG